MEQLDLTLTRRSTPNLTYASPTDAQGAALFVATDDARMLRALKAALPETIVVARDVPRSESSMNPVLDGGNENASATAGADVLVDTLLLSRCSFLLKCASMVSEAATYFAPRLIDNSYDYHVRNHPPPKWAGACKNRRIRVRAKTRVSGV